MKAQALADNLVENPVDDEYQPLITYFPGEEVNSVKGKWETRDIKLIPYRQHVEDLSKWFKSVEFRYIPRFHNELADALATLASMLPYLGNVHIEPLEIQIRERDGYCNTIELKPNVQPWYHNMKRFLKTKEYPEQASRNQKRTIRRIASGFFLSGEVHSDLINAPPSELHPMSTPWPFVAWGMDVIRPIKPKASNGQMFILVAIDYFTKWVEAVTLKAVTKKAVVDFVHSNIIYRFGIPTTIITDNAANLNSHLMREICEQFKIKHQNSTPYRPKANVGATPYLLVYGTEAVIPEEVEIPSLRIIVEVEIEDSEWVKTRLEQLNLIDEKQMAAVCHGKLYQQRMARAYNKKVRTRNFEVGQLVLRRILPYHKEAKGKFTPNWKGPYIIRKFLMKEALYLGDIEGNNPETIVNADAAKRYYI
ncbi:uncharacterized protein [Nicotiana sylvestris]|uniref:uncharacterized protein n=1 Tax=Nicotiana sylvestris TaxID=4096 RepID=UPI00388CE5E4